MTRKTLHCEFTATVLDIMNRLRNVFRQKNKKKSQMKEELRSFLLNDVIIRENLQ